MIQNVRNCPRCKGDHQKLIFKELARQHGNNGWSHWSMCPVLQEPIMLQVGGGTKEPPRIVVQNEWVNPVDEIAAILAGSEDAGQKLTSVEVIIAAAKE